VNSFFSSQAYLNLFKPVVSQVDMSIHLGEARNFGPERRWGAVMDQIEAPRRWRDESFIEVTAEKDEAIGFFVVSVKVGNVREDWPMPRVWAEVSRKWIDDETGSVPRDAADFEHINPPHDESALPQDARRDTMRMIFDTLFMKMIVAPASAYRAPSLSDDGLTLLPGGPLDWPRLRRSMVNYHKYRQNGPNAQHDYRRFYTDFYGFVSGTSAAGAGGDAGGGGWQESSRGKSIIEVLSTKCGFARKDLTGITAGNISRLVIGNSKPEYGTATFGVPLGAADSLTVSFVATRNNIDLLREDANQISKERVEFGRTPHFTVLDHTSGSLEDILRDNEGKYVGNVDAQKITLGATISRSLKDGDLVNINRQPTLSRFSEQASGGSAPRPPRLRRACGFVGGAYLRT
jgi:hypothetical protein